MITAIVVVNDLDKNDFTLVKDLDHTHKDRCLPVALDYLAEGGANVVLRLVAFARASKLKTPPNALVNKLVRVRKDKGFVMEAKQQQEKFQHDIAPLFTQENLVNPMLIKVDKAFLAAVNQELATLQAQGVRSNKRLGDTVNEREEHAILMTDMSPVGVEVSLEIKPKWLAQSPNAPATAKRCRTCALRAQRTRSGRLDPAKATERAFCPLALLSGDRDAQLQAATAILKANKVFHWMTDGPRLLVDMIPTSVKPLLARIRDFQTRLDPEGILSLPEGEFPSNDYLIAMTLRDCAMFLRTNESLHAGPVEVRLADLDAKMPHPDKVKRWRETEYTLIHEGWYDGTELDPAHETVCILSKSSSTAEPQDTRRVINTTE